MGREPETDSVAVDFDPHMSTRVTRTPAHQDHGVKLFKSSATLERSSIDGFKHFGEAAFLQDMLRIFAHSLTPGRVRFLTEDKF